jgi:hypothetical protein
MKKINDTEHALSIFEIASNGQVEATGHGDYKKANKYYSDIISAIDFLKAKNAISALKKYVDSPSIGVRLWVATFWLAVDEHIATKILNDIVKTSGIHSLTAKMTLTEWQNGNLKL